MAIFPKGAQSGWAPPPTDDVSGRYQGFITDMDDVGAAAGEGLAAIDAKAESAQKQIAAAVKGWLDGQATLNDRADLLNARIGEYEVFFNRGSASLPAAVSIGRTWKKISMGRIIGPHQGCRLVDGGWVLDEAGVWNIHGQATLFAGGLATRGSNVELRVFSPTGTLFSKVKWTSTVSTSGTAVMSRDVVVDKPGYRVELWAAMTAGGSVGGGDDGTFVWVQHQNRTVAGGRGDAIDIIDDMTEVPPEPEPIT